MSLSTRSSVPTLRRRLRPRRLIGALATAVCGLAWVGHARIAHAQSADPIDVELRALIELRGLTGDPSRDRDLPSIRDPLAQLGKLLFFSKSLGGDRDTACASCHHPALGGGDGLSLPVGTGAVDPDVVGPGRTRPDGLPNVGRHTPSVFNVGLYDSSLFWDSRVESLGKEAGQNGARSGVRTPETPYGVADAWVPAGSTLPAAQARLPVTVPEEMRGDLLPGAHPEALRRHLAARIGDYGAGHGELATNRWLAAFRTAFASQAPAEELITFDSIALAIAEYQRSMVFVDTPWKAYVEGDLDAIELGAKRGALLFLREPQEQGTGCAQCHRGDFFTDEAPRVVGFPQIGPGKGDGAAGDEDFGIERHTANPADRFRFRTPTLLNVTVTAPYTHSGVYEVLTDTMSHYFAPDVIFGIFRDAGGTCSLSQFRDHPECASLYPNLIPNSNAALDAVLNARVTDPEATFSDPGEFSVAVGGALERFLEALTDPCTRDRSCLAPWIPEPSEAPDENQLNAVDGDGNPL